MQPYINVDSVITNMGQCLENKLFCIDVEFNPGLSFKATDIHSKQEENKEFCHDSIFCFSTR